MPHLLPGMLSPRKSGRHISYNLPEVSIATGFLSGLPICYTTRTARSSGIRTSANASPPTAPDAAVWVLQSGGILAEGRICLGTGTSGYYSNELDHFRFYEIDPIAKELARNYFTFIDNAQGKIDAIIGDGRIMMEGEWEASGSQNYESLR